MKTSRHNHISLTVSIVLYNSNLELLQRTLISLHLAVQKARALAAVDSILVVIIDNSSDHDIRQASLAATQQWQHTENCPLKYTQSSDNRGFGAGNNAALSCVNSDYHLILNPDVELAEEALASGLNYMQAHPEVVLLSPRVVGDDGQQEFLCKRYPSVSLLLLRGFAPSFIQRWFQQRLEGYEMRAECRGDQPCEATLASGCFMLVRTQALKEVGGFNERYFLYFEDFDLSLRLASWGQLVFQPTMNIVHHGGYAASKGIRHIGLFIRSGIRFFNDHGWRWL